MSEMLTQERLNEILKEMKEKEKNDVIWYKHIFLASTEMEKNSYRTQMLCDIAKRFKDQLTDIERAVLFEEELVERNEEMYDRNHVPSLTEILQILELWFDK